MVLGTRIEDCVFANSLWYACLAPLAGCVSDSCQDQEMVMNKLDTGDRFRYYHSS